MNRAVRFTLTAGAVALVCACRSDTLTPPIGRPLASLSDGAHSGNPDFFFLPPIFKDPSSDPNFTAGAFNASVRPTVEICALGALVPPSPIRPCAATFKTFAASDIQLDAANQQYVANWDTKAPNLDVTKDYRIRVLLGPNTELGFADVDPVATGSGLRRVDTGEFIGLIDGRTLPIKFRIENGAACNGGQCNSKTIDLSQGGFVVFDATGDRIDIPAQQSGRVVTLTVQACPNLDIAIPVFGNCLRALADPPLGTTRLSPPATVSLCSLRSFPLPPLHDQQELITLHRQDGEVVLALPHSTDFCGAGTIGRSDGAAPRTLADRSWRALRRAAEWLFKPATLHASSLMFDVGAGGQTDGFSDFQFALPAKMDFASLVDQSTAPNTAVPSAPSVLVTDADGNPVANARVHFQITSTGGGSFTPPSPILTDASGHATLTQWVLGAVGTHALQASGRGIADPQNNGPAAGFDPFAPAVLHDPSQDEAQAPVTLGTGQLTFTATASGVDLIVSTGAPTVTPSTVTAGSTVTLSAWTIFNQGNANPTSGVSNGFYLSTDPVITTSDVRLDFNNNTAGVLTAGNGFNWGGPTLTIPASTAPGTYYIGILVDEGNAVAEANESNNYVSTQLIVLAAPVVGAPKVQ